MDKIICRQPLDVYREGCLHIVQTGTYAAVPGMEFVRFVLHQFLLNIMHQLALISEKIGALWNLSQKDVIFLDDLQPEFRPGLQTFIIGETLSMKDGKIVIGHNLYKKWLEQIKARGFDYEIDFK